MVTTKSEAYIMVHVALNTISIRELKEIIDTLNELLLPFSTNESLRDSLIMVKEVVDGQLH